MTWESLLAEVSVSVKGSNTTALCVPSGQCSTNSTRFVEIQPSLQVAHFRLSCGSEGPTMSSVGHVQSSSDEVTLAERGKVDDSLKRMAERI